MTMNTSSPRRNLDGIVMLLVVFMAIQSQFVFPQISESYIVQGIVIITAKGVYELIIGLLYWSINHSSILLRLVWGPLFLKGIWSYAYSLNEKEYRGVWEIDQDIDGHSLVGNGVGDDFHVRTIVRSVSPLVPEQGGYYFINLRNELLNNNARVLSRTTLLLDRPRRSWGLVMKMRATTEVYGGPSDGQLHADVVFTRHPEADSIEDVMAHMREAAQRHINEAGNS